MLTVTTEIQFHVIHLCSETRFSMKLRPVSINGSRCYGTVVDVVGRAVSCVCVCSFSMLEKEKDLSCQHQSPYRCCPWQALCMH